MRNKYVYLFFIWFDLLLLCLFGCNSTPKQGVKLDLIKNYSKTISINIGTFKLELESDIIRDTLGGQWEDAIYGSPIIKKQKLIFYKGGIELKTHSFPISLVSKTTKSAQKIDVVTFPVIDICLIRGGNGAWLYYLYGADFCNGVACPEFRGLYDMDGNVVYEGVSTNKLAVNEFEKVQNKYKLDIDKSDTCQTILGIWK